MIYIYVLLEIGPFATCFKQMKVLGMSSLTWGSKLHEKKGLAYQNAMFRCAQTFGYIVYLKANVGDALQHQGPWFHFELELQSLWSFACVLVSAWTSSPPESMSLHWLCYSRLSLGVNLCTWYPAMNTSKVYFCLPPFVSGIGSEK